MEDINIMAMFLLKPIFWNNNNYLRPSGVRASQKSYPGEHGFGHEEWNNSPRLQFKENGERWRIFHTEGIGNARVDDHAGQVFVFMTATHGAGHQQYLVGLGGNAMWLGTDNHLTERERLVAKLKLEDLWQDAWELERVRKCYRNQRSRAEAEFRRTQEWIPTWISRADDVWWPETPIPLNPLQITGKNALPMMFSQHMEISRQQAEILMSMVPADQRNDCYSHLVHAMSIAPSHGTPHDVLEPKSKAAAKATSTLTTVQARIGQGAFRRDLEAFWGNRCAVHRELACRELLVASHIKPWSKCDNGKQQLDPFNGLLLSANLDALFDKALISFTNEGEMLVSNRVSVVERKLLGIPKALSKAPTAEHIPYLEYHRDTFLNTNQ